MDCVAQHMAPLGIGASQDHDLKPEAWSPEDPPSSSREHSDPPEGAPSMTFRGGDGGLLDFGTHPA